MKYSVKRLQNEKISDQGREEVAYGSGRGDGPGIGNYARRLCPGKEDENKCSRWTNNPLRGEIAWFAKPKGKGVKSTETKE